MKVNYQVIYDSRHVLQIYARSKTHCGANEVFSASRLPRCVYTHLAIFAGIGWPKLRKRHTVNVCVYLRFFLVAFFSNPPDICAIVKKAVLSYLSDTA